MSNNDETPNLNGPELNPNVVETNIDVGEKSENEPTPNELLKSLENQTATKQQEIIRLTESTERTKAGLSEVRKRIGLSSFEKEIPSISLEKERLEALQAEQERLEKLREETLNQQEKERLIREEKEKILQEKLDGLFKEFEALNPIDFESIFRNGKTINGRNFESKSVGSLNPETAQSLAKAFKEGIKLLPKILEILPELLKKFDEDLTREATRRVKEKLEKEKSKTKELEGENEKPEEINVTENTVPPDQIKPEQNPVGNGNTETVNKI